MFSKIRQFFLKKASKKTPNYTFTDTDRLHANEMKRINAEIKKAEREIELEYKRAELYDLQERLGMFEEDDEEEDISTPQTPEALFMSILAQRMAQTTPPLTAPPTNATGGAPSNEQLKQELTTRLTPQEIGALKTLKDAELQSIIKNNYPSFDSDTINRAVVVIREN